MEATILTILLIIYLFLGACLGYFEAILGDNQGWDLKRFLSVMVFWPSMLV
jgi:hypothetical protein